MKQTINANIGGVALTVDEDAYRILEQYLGDIKSRLDDSNAYILEDVEVRVAELLREQLPSPIHVVTAEMTRRVIARIGRPEEFGNRKTTAESNTTYQQEQPKRLVRVREDRIFAGVCGGVARYFDKDVALIRTIAVLIFILGSMGLWIYLIMAICIPNEKEVAQYENQGKQK